MYYLIPSICLQELYLVYLVASATCHAIVLFLQRDAALPLFRGLTRQKCGWMSWCGAGIAAESPCVCTGGT